MDYWGHDLLLVRQDYYLGHGGRVGVSSLQGLGLGLGVTSLRGRGLGPRMT